jgi:phosphoglycolate phosphatase-like HAD superfamily hydrolase
MLGLAPVLDFDGTLADLEVDWVELRRSLKVDRIDDLWYRSGGWDTVTAAEIEAATVASPVIPVELLSTVSCFSVVTSNAASAVHRFVDRFPVLKQRLSIVVGREELGGPKTEFKRFELGVQRCLEATDQQRTESPSTYVGDSDYELDFARRLGMRAVDVRDLIGRESIQRGGI